MTQQASSNSEETWDRRIANNVQDVFVETKPIMTIVFHIYFLKNYKFGKIRSISIEKTTFPVKQSEHIYDWHAGKQSHPNTSNLK